MTLWAHVHGGYASYDGTPHKWGQAEYDSFKLIQTLKGKPINGYATLRKPNGKSVTIRTHMPHGAFELWGEWAALKAAQLAPGGAYIIPIPSADCIAIGTDGKGAALAAAVAKRAPGLIAVDAIHWAVAFVKASQGGPRDVDTLFENVRVLANLPKSEVILVDDVITGGGHAIACARAMRWAGHKVEHVIAAGHTVHEPPPGGIFNIPSWDLEADPLDLDWI